MAAGRRLPPERYFEVRYEDLCDRPVETFLDVSERVKLRWERAFVESLLGDVKSRNYKWREAFTPQEIATLNALVGDLLLRLGYELEPQSRQVTT